MSPLADYQIVASKDYLALAEKVKALLPDWTPFGPPVSHHGLLLQAMVKREETGEE